MEIRIENEAAAQQQQPLLQDQEKPQAIFQDDQKTSIQKAMSQTFRSTAHLANLLPTGSVLAFQLLSPVFTNQGKCIPLNQSMTCCLLALCGISCFLLSFTDSVRDEEGKVRYGVATRKGLWVIDGAEPTTLTPEEASRYRLRLLDLVHAFMSILVFGAVVLFDQNVVRCFYPTPSEEIKQVLTGLPVGIGVICSMLFLAFPTKRHGIGFPLSPH